MPKDKRKRDAAGSGSSNSGGSNNLSPSSSATTASAATTSASSFTHVDAAYAAVDGYEIARAEKKRQRDTGVILDGIQYGEIATAAFAEALGWCAPQAGEKFVDLGSGTGKAVLSAAAAYAFSSATGVEILQPLHEAAMAARARCNELKTEDVRFVCADAIKFPWTDHDVVFVSLTCFTDDMVASIAADAKQLAKGSRMLVTSRALECPGALRLLKRGQLPYGKGRMTFLAYERI